MTDETLAKILVLANKINTDVDIYGVDGYPVLQVQIGEITLWDTFETHVILKLNGGGYGLYSVYPYGYGEETYEPITSFNQYPHYDALQFIKLALTQDLRDAFKGKYEQ